MRQEYINYSSNLPVKISYSNISKYPIHWHNSIEILYVVKGSITVTIDTDSFEILEKEIEIINVNEAHSISSTNDNEVITFHIDPSFFEKYYKDINNMFFYTNTSDENAQYSKEYDKLRTLLSMILCEYTQKIEDYDKEISSILIDLLYHLINNFHYLTYEKEELKENTQQLARYHRIAKYIFDNYDSNITLQDIANEEFLSTHYLSHEIKNATGKSFTDLLNLTRVEESIKLLLDSDLSISDIAEKVGFSHVRYLNKNFKILYNCTPLQYRKKYKVSEEQLKKLKVINDLPLSEALTLLSYHLEDYERYNFENKLWKINIDMNTTLKPFDNTYKEILNLGDSFDLLIEDNKDILEEIQDEINFNYGRLEYLFSSNMSIFPNSDFYNWNKTKSVIEFLDFINLKPLIVLDNVSFSVEKYIQIFDSFFSYFSEIDYLDLKDYKFQFSSNIDINIKTELTEILSEKYNLTILSEDFTSVNNLNKIYDTTFMLPYVINNSIFNSNFNNNLRAFDVLENEVRLTNEVFIGAQGIVNDMGIRKPSYYAYYLLSKLGGDVVCIDDGYIVTKKETEYCILLYSHNNDLNTLPNYEDIYLKKGDGRVYKKKYSINIVNINSNSRITTYEINEKVGSSYNYWLSMGSPDRINKEEKEILHKASFPKISFKYFKKSTVLNILSEIKGYGAQLILIKNIK